MGKRRAEEIRLRLLLAFAFLLIASGAPGGSFAATPSEPPQAVSKGVDEDSAVTEAMQMQKKQAAIYEAMNEVNPVSADFTSDPKALPKDISATDAEAVTRFRATAHSNPVASFILFLCGDLNFIQTAQKVFHHPSRARILILEFFLLMVFVIFRTWKLHYTTGVFAKFWVGLWTFGVYATLALSIIPRLFIGEDYASLFHQANVAVKHAIEAERAAKIRIPAEQAAPAPAAPTKAKSDSTLPSR